MNYQKIQAPVAAIDLGSNTVRLLVASPHPNGAEKRLVRQTTTRLGQGLTPGRSLSSASVRRTWEALRDYHQDVAALGVQKTLVGATMAAREASDGPEFLRRIQEAFGFDTMILSGGQEAELSAAGVLTVLDPVPETAVVFDIGGRSTEFILVEAGRVKASVSLGLGAVSLTEADLKHDPPSEAELASLRSRAASVLNQGVPAAFPRGQGTLVGTAGTVTTLAAIDLKMEAYEPERINNLRLDRETLEALYDRMRALPVADRAALPGLEEARADIIVAGAVAVLEIMAFFDHNHMIVSDAGLLEGLWLAAAGLRSV